MAESKNNVVTHGLSGKVGDLLVFSQKYGKTFVSKAPKERTGELSEKQKQHKIKFQRAVLYAKSVLADPSKTQIYGTKADHSRGVTTYNVAVADLLNAPDIEKIDLSEYKGNIGDSIKITVFDDFQVVSVVVRIENADGSLVEEGSAVDNGIEWVYIATVANSDLEGDKITVKATDNPANLTEMTQEL